MGLRKIYFNRRFMKKVILWLSVIALVIAVICYGRAQARNNDEFEYVTEETDYTNSFGESFTITKSTYVNLSPTRSGYERLNIYNEADGFIFADVRSYHEVKCVLKLGCADDRVPIYAIVYENGSEFISWKNGGTYSIEYTADKINSEYLSEQYKSYPAFDSVSIFLVKNAEEIKEKFLSEKLSDSAISKLIDEMREIG